MEENYNIIKVAVATVGAFFTSLFASIAAPMVVLVSLNIIDYITALAAAPYRGEPRESEKGIKGINKKVCMWLLVAIGGVLDWLIIYASEMVGVEIKLKFALAAAVAIWIICNEIISILENIGDIGVKLPPFLSVMVQWVKKSTEEKVNITGGAERENIRN